MSTQATKRKCKFCLTEFEPSRSNHVFCTKQCYRRYSYHLDVLRKNNGTVPTPKFRRDGICHICEQRPLHVTDNGTRCSYCRECLRDYYRGKTALNRKNSKLNKFARILGAQNHA